MPSESLSTGQLVQGLQSCSAVVSVYFSGEPSKAAPNNITRGFINKVPNTRIICIYEKRELISFITIFLAGVLDL